MKNRNASAEEPTRDAKYSELIADYLGRIAEVRVDMRRSQAEIERLKVASRKKLLVIDAVLNAC